VADDLLASGLFDRSPAWLAHAIRDLLADRDDLLGLEPNERERLAACLPELLERCELLAEGPLPVALVHGDLHLANVARGRDGYVFFDWTDACVAHPLMDLLLVIFEEDEALREALRDVYLAAWIETASPDELLELWHLAQPLAALNQAISYLSIVDSVEPGTGGELTPMLPWWLRKALAAVD
jgi:aminoglycoside phosphotransferase (APT) family kinase protein